MHPYLPHTEEDIAYMLQAIGVDSLEALFSDIPEELRLNRALTIGEGLSEIQIRKELGELAASNTTLDHVTSFLGGGAYQHYVPSVIKYLVSRQEFSTAYTPYQPEISQGTLQAIFEYQSMICELTGMDVSNASLYDGGTALAEAVFLANHSNNKRTVLLSKTVNPEYKNVVKTYAKYNELNVIEIETCEYTTSIEDLKQHMNEEVSCVVIQNPNYYGIVEDGHKIREAMDTVKSKAQFIVSTHPISLGILEAPRWYGADTVVGEGQPLGSEVQFGGPYLGFIASTKDNMRRMPGRIVGQTVDKQGKRAFVLTLQAREQHIRREKAMSNITSNQGLIALTATVYLSLMGKTGIKEVASQCISKAHYLADRLTQIEGISLAADAPYFNEFVILSEKPLTAFVKQMEDKGYFPGILLSEHTLLVCVTEVHSKDVLDRFVLDWEEVYYGI